MGHVSGLRSVLPCSTDAASSAPRGLTVGLITVTFCPRVCPFELAWSLCSYGDAARKAEQLDMYVAVDGFGKNVDHMLSVTALDLSYLSYLSSRRWCSFAYSYLMVCNLLSWVCGRVFTSETAAGRAGSCHR